ncbi:uncharacterized protein LOC143878931 isoform X2 [Tasmannia lanceolata]|uniref:uncharacterized protein LOC143878931 isoform X2 n=1 Tax=Tasmannia lanceolata TaxID=3420 RepID=UPI004064BE1E
MTMMLALCGCKHFLLYLTMFVVMVLAENHGNPANELVDIINENRTSHKLPKLRDNPGLGCMALQYIDKCKGNCTSTNTVSCQPPEEDITEVFAPNCGVELPTVDIISGRIIGCHSKYFNPVQAFSNILVQANKTTLAILRDKQHTEVGVGLTGTHRGPFFWCVLFSSGQTNSTFVLEGGRGIKQKTGCFSGTDIPCSTGPKLLVLHGLPVLILALLICFINATITYS